MKDRGFHQISLVFVRVFASCVFLKSDFACFPNVFVEFREKLALPAQGLLLSLDVIPVQECGVDPGGI